MPNQILDQFLPPLSSFVPYSQNYGGQAGRGPIVNVSWDSNPRLSPIVPAGQRILLNLTICPLFRSLITLPARNRGRGRRRERGRFESAR